MRLNPPEKCAFGVRRGKFLEFLRFLLTNQRIEAKFGEVLCNIGDKEFEHLQRGTTADRVQGEWSPSLGF